MENFRLDFKAANGCPSACNLTIHREISLVIATEINVGSSVTNSCERIANEVVRRYAIDPKRLMFIEHYPAEQRDGTPTYDLVTFKVIGETLYNPAWRHIPLSEIESILKTIAA